MRQDSKRIQVNAKDTKKDFSWKKVRQARSLPLGWLGAVSVFKLSSQSAWGAQATAGLIAGCGDRISGPGVHRAQQAQQRAKGQVLMFKSIPDPGQQCFGHAASPPAQASRELLFKLQRNNKRLSRINDCGQAKPEVSNAENRRHNRSLVPKEQAYSAQLTDELRNSISQAFMRTER